MNDNIIYVCAENSAYEEKAKKLGTDLTNCFIRCEIRDLKNLSEDAVSLVYREGGLFFESEGQSMHGDFSSMKKRLMYNNLTHEMIVKASKTKGIDEPFAVDCTAGMGEDSVLLAGAGFNVLLFERNPVIAALLEDTIERALLDDELKDIAGRMRLIKGDSIKGLRELETVPDAVILDPMFPERNKSSLVKKKFQLIHLLEEPCTDEEELLNAALSTGAHKTVIKRPLKGPYLAGVKPGYSLTGKTVRYDIIVR